MLKTKIIKELHTKDLFKLQRREKNYRFRE